jgi:hypothetical protein
MTKLKIYSQYKPVKLNGHLEIYNISYGGGAGNRKFYSEISTDDYDTSRSELEKEGYTAHPADSTEIASNNYTIFQGAV